MHPKPKNENKAKNKKMKLQIKVKTLLRQRTFDEIHGMDTLDLVRSSGA